MPETIILRKLGVTILISDKIDNNIYRVSKYLPTNIY